VERPPRSSTPFSFGASRLPGDLWRVPPTGSTPVSSTESLPRIGTGSLIICVRQWPAAAPPTVHLGQQPPGASLILRVVYR